MGEIAAPKRQLDGAAMLSVPSDPRERGTRNKAMSPHAERRLLQLIILIAGFVPVLAGVWGATGGLHPPGLSADSQARYLSGLLLGIGLCFWGCLPRIERRGAEVRILAGVVVAGGLARLGGALSTGAWGLAVALPLVMELGVTPLVALWRERVERRLRA